MLKLIIENDIFGYQNSVVDPSSKIFELFPNALIRLLYSSVKLSKPQNPDNSVNIKVTQYTIALLNAITSSKIGRDYLLPKDENQAHGDHMTQLLLKRLTQILNKETSDTLLRQYI